MSAPEEDSAEQHAPLSRQDVVEGLDGVMRTLRRIHDDSEGHRERRLMERALDHLTDAQAIARREHHS